MPVRNSFFHNTSIPFTIAYSRNLPSKSVTEKTLRNHAIRCVDFSQAFGYRNVRVLGHILAVRHSFHFALLRLSGADPLFCPTNVVLSEAIPSNTRRHGTSVGLSSFYEYECSNQHLAFTLLPNVNVNIFALRTVTFTSKCSAPLSTIYCLHMACCGLGVVGYRCTWLHLDSSPYRLTVDHTREMARDRHFSMAVRVSHESCRHPQNILKRYCLRMPCVAEKYTHQKSAPESQSILSKGRPKCANMKEEREVCRSPPQASAIFSVHLSPPRKCRRQRRSGGGRSGGRRRSVVVPATDIAATRGTRAAVRWLDAMHGSRGTASSRLPWKSMLRRTPSCPGFS